MKKLMFFMIPLILLSTVSADSLNIVSDTSNEYADGSNWNAAVAVSWIHPSWTSYITIPATWIWRSAGVTNEEAVNGATVDFRKIFNIPTCASNIQGSIDITTDNEYDLSINDQFVGHNADWTQSESYNIGSYLTPGTNTIKITAINEPMNGGTPTTNPAGVIYSADISYDACDEQEVPEFTTIGAVLALVGAGIYIYKKKQ